MRKVIGIGETILDIIFRNGQPTAAVPGGSVFNGVVSLARAGVPVSFISETGNDRVGNTILQSMRDSGMSTDYVNVFPDGKSPVSLAYLNENGDAEYIFYKDYPKQRLDVVFAKRSWICWNRHARRKQSCTMTPTSGHRIKARLSS